jgi:hypothetical protein
MADTILDLTGGDTRVANLRDGFFGAQGKNRATEFGKALSFNDEIVANTSSEDWAARYLLWMGLGGTQRRIPAPVLNVVATTLVFGEKRGGLERLGKVGANMLAVPEFLCKQLLQPDPALDWLPFDLGRGLLPSRNYFPQKDPKVRPGQPFFSNNGDLELWERICSGGEAFPFVMRVFMRKHEHEPDLETGPVALPDRTRADFESGMRVGQGGQVVASLTDANSRPWCLDLSDPDTRDAILSAFRSKYPGQEPPECPPARHAVDPALWAKRGAMYAGLTVFFYLDALTRGQVESPVEYDKCEKLPEPSACKGQP